MLLKRNISLIGLLCFTLNFCGAQNYTPFPQSNSIWKFIYWDVDCQVSPCEYDEFKIDKDTLLSNKLYILIHEYSYIPVENFYYDAQREWAIRNDSVSRKVYFNDLFPGDSDQLLYDFNLQVGELLPSTYLHQQNDSLYVSGIDSIKIGNHYNRRYLLTGFQTGYKDDTTVGLIEGVGSMFGLFDNFGEGVGFEGGHFITCFVHNQSVYYFDSLSADSYPCEFPTGIDNIVSNPLISIYPNPVNIGENINIEYPVNGSVQVMIYDNLGREISDYSFVDRSLKIHINTSLFNTGIYYIVFEQSTRVGVEKLVVLN